MSQVLQFTKGTDRSYDLELRDDLGQAITAFTVSDLLSARVWLGGDTAVIFAPTASWVSAPAGTYQLSFAAADTATLDAGRYFLDVKITKAVGGRVIDALDAQVELLEAPGTAEALSTYGTLRDALEYAPWLKDAITDQDLGDLSTHFHNARTWLEGIIQNKYRAGTYSGPEVYGNRVRITYYPQSGEQNKYLQDLLDANKLMVRPRVVEMTAKRAIGTICRSMISPMAGDSNYQHLARSFLAEADALVLCYTAEIDSNADGYPDLTVPCGACSIR
jgi:hypothetical protein